MLKADLISVRRSLFCLVTPFPLIPVKHFLKNRIKSALYMCPLPAVIAEVISVALGNIQFGLAKTQTGS